MASILRKLVISMLVPYLWRRWRDRDRTGTVEAQGSGVRAQGTAPPHEAPARR